MHDNIDTSEPRSVRPRATKKPSALPSKRQETKEQLAVRSLPVLVVSEREAARMYGMSPSSMQRLRASQDGPPPYVRLTEGRIGYRVRDLEAWLETRLAR
jgi:hypothetical protein